MAAAKQRADKQKQKEKKEKMILGGLLAILLVVGAIQVPSMLKKKESSAASGSTTVTTTASNETTPTGTASGTETQPATGGGDGTLQKAPDYRPGSGQLSGFGIFASKDPFGTAPTGGEGGPATGSGTGTNVAGSEYAGALISVNGNEEVVPFGALFPAAEPTFTLDFIAKKSVRIKVAGGSFAGSQDSLTLRKGRKVVLQNTADGLTYELELVKVGKSLEQLAPTGTGSTTTTSAGTTTGSTTTSSSTTTS